LITIDFETYSEADLKKVGAYKYAEHPSTEILCLCYNFPEDREKVYLWTPEGGDMPDDLFRAIEQGEKIEAHNAPFERVIWRLVGMKKHGYKLDIPLKQIYCSAAKGSAHAMPRDLGGLADALEVPIKKDKDGHRIMLQLSKPRKPTKNNPSTRHNDFEKYEKLYDYCETDVLAEKASSRVVPELSALERRVWELDQTINDRGIYCDIELCKVAIEFADTFQNKLLGELSELTSGQVQTARQVAKFNGWLRTQGVELPNLQAATVEDALKDESIQGKGRRALEIRQHLSKSSISKFEAMVRMAGEDNRIRGTLLYHGASTGRWSGRGIQPQNFIRGSVKDLATLFETLEQRDLDLFEMLYENPMDALASATRGMLRAAPGHDLIAGDYAAIEARALFWLAGCPDGLEAFNKGLDIYKIMASKIFKVPIDKVTPEQRQLGKQAILGLGYGMGKPKFRDTCLGYGMNVSDRLAAHSVETYRGEYYQVPEFWKGMEAAAVKAVQTGQVIKYKHVKWGVKGRWLYCQLPSTRKLAYYDPKIKQVATQWGGKPTLTFMGTNSVTRQWERQKTYGGKLVENVTQAVARDLMVNSMFELEKENYPIVLTVHDEVVCEIKKDFGSVEEYEEIMERLPKWASDFPMKAEAWRASRFKK